MQEISFDIIGDLYLSVNEHFTWEGKATSLYCIIAGNISNDVNTIKKVLTHLSQVYQGVFYVPGTLEYDSTESIPERLSEIIHIVNRIPNMCMLHQHVAVIDGVAIVGVNGWCDAGINQTFEDLVRTIAREEDISYLKSSVKKLQRHLDIKKIIVVTNAVPLKELYYHENPDYVDDQSELTAILDNDTENKITHWVFGTYNKIVDTTINNIHYLNNPKPSTSPYWAKRLSIEVGV